MPRKILLITDIGSDIDDVWCFLALAHLQEQRHVRIVGIVTTGGNVSARAMIARRWALGGPLSMRPLLFTRRGPASQPARRGLFGTGSPRRKPQRRHAQEHQ